MARRSQSSWALSLGMIAWIGLLFCGPLFFASTARADDVSEYGTVIGIVSCTASKRSGLALWPLVCSADG
jgi:hypothetical protein